MTRLQESFENWFLRHHRQDHSLLNAKNKFDHYINQDVEGMWFAYKGGAEHASLPVTNEFIK